MMSLYDVLGARADDDAQAIKKAFRTAVKAHHPDLHPDDPDAVLRFRRILTASAILRDPKQRAAYDQLLELERQRIKLRLDMQHLQLQHRRRKQLKVGAAAVVVACALAGGYGLLMPKPTTAVVEVMKDKPAAIRTATIVETITRDKAVTASPGMNGGRDHPAAAAVETVRVETGNAGGVASRNALEAVGETPPRRDAGATPAAATDGLRTAAPVSAVAAVSVDNALPPPVVAGDGRDTVAHANRERAPPPGDANFYRDVGTAAYRAGDFPHAIVNLDEAIRIDRNDARAYNVRGNAWDEIGDFEKALADYDEAIRLEPKNPFFFHDRAIMWHRRGELDKALVDLDRAIRLSFSDPNVYCDRGLIWYEKGSHARATADFDHAVKLDPDFAAACISRGLILHRDSEFTVALTDLGKTIRVSPAVFDVAKRVASHQ